MKKPIVNLLALLVVLFPAALCAQTSSINAFSPYSMYGIGEINTQGSLPSRSMGGVGVGMRSVSGVNLLNPAAYSVTLRKSILFNFGLEGQNFYNSQRRADGSLAKTSYNTFNFHDIALQIPLAKGLGLGFSLSPYSSVGYRTSHLEEKDEIWGDIGRVKYAHTGEGDITEVKLGVGWEIFKNFSIGLAAQYYWGDIDRGFSTTIIPYVGDGKYTPIIGSSNYSVSRFKGQFGVQYNAISTSKRTLTLGATYTLGGNLNPRVTNTIYINDNFNTTAQGDTTHLAVVLPHQLAVGAFYETPRFSVGLDYLYQNWSGNSNQTEKAVGGFTVAYRNTHTLKFGVEWTPNRNDVRRFYKRWHYRAGVNYGNYYQTFGGQNVTQYAVTAGIGIPVKFAGFSAIDVGVEFGGRGRHTNIAERVGLIKQNYFKFSIGFAMFGEDYWFVRPKYE
ncbi:MAG: hypothetical protein RR330_04405 [Alistipes sp.]